MDRSLFGVVLATAFVTCALSSPAHAQSLSARLEMVGPGASRYQRAIESQLATVLALTDAPPATIVGPLGPVGTATASTSTEPALRVRVQIVGRGRRARAIVDVATGAGYPLLSRTIPGIAGEMGTDVLAAAALDAVRDGAIALVEHERSRAREESLARARRAEESRRRELADEAEERRADEERAANAVRLRTSGGFALRIRTLDVVLAGEDQLVHESGPFAEMTLLVEARPFAASGGVLGGLYAELLGAAAVGLTALQEGGESLDVQAFRLSGSVGYRHAFGPLEVGGGLGVGWESFSLGRNAIAPSTSMPYLRFGPSARLELLGDKVLTASLDAGLRLPLGVGELGERFGPASAMGIDVSAGLDGQRGRFVYGLHLGLTRIGLSWERGASGGALPASEEAVSAVDGSLWAMATAGYQIF